VIYKFLANSVLCIHFAWIVFIIWGVILTAKHVMQYFFFKNEQSKIFFDRWLFRSVHLFGILFVGALAIMDKYCPLTNLENFFRVNYNSGLYYPSSFIMHYIEKLVYPDVRPEYIIYPTLFIAIFTLIVFIIKPPEKIRHFFRCRKYDNL